MLNNHVDILNAKTAKVPFKDKVCSVKNEYSNNIKHKVITLFRIKIKFKQPQTSTGVERVIVPFKVETYKKAA